jgi:hypothetical protein
MPHLKFSLPDTKLSLDIEAEVAWADLKGRAGLRFHDLPKGAQEQLEKWLDEHLEQELPGSKERLAATESEDVQ